MTNKWPRFVTKDLRLGEEDEDEAELWRRWETYDREMKALIAAGGLHQDEDGWWVDDATGELIGPDPEIERPLREGEHVTLKPFGEVFPEVAASLRRRGPGKKPKKEVVTLRLDPDVIAAFKSEGEGWQSRINTALRAAKKLPAA